MKLFDKKPELNMTEGQNLPSGSNLSSGLNLTHVGLSLSLGGWTYPMAELAPGRRRSEGWQIQGRLFPREDFCFGKKKLFSHFTTLPTSLSQCFFWRNNNQKNGPILILILRLPESSSYLYKNVFWNHIRDTIRYGIKVLIATSCQKCTWQHSWHRVAQPAAPVAGQYCQTNEWTNFSWFY